MSDAVTRARELLAKATPDEWGELADVATMAEAELIAAAPTLLAELADEVERLRALTAVDDAMVERAAKVLGDDGADSEGGWHSWRCFDRARYPEPCTCTRDAARAALEAAMGVES